MTVGSQKSLIAITLCVTARLLVAQELPCTHDSRLRTYGEWLQATPLAHGQAFRATPAKRERIVRLARKLQLQATRDEVERLLGKPDFESLGKTPRVLPANNPDARTTCWYQWVYYLAKRDSNPINASDQGLFLTFDHDGRLGWVSPLNIKGLKEMGAPVTK